MPDCVEKACSSLQLTSLAKIYCLTCYQYWSEADEREDLKPKMVPFLEVSFQIFKDKQ